MLHATTLPTTAGNKLLYPSPFTGRHQQYSLCLHHCNNKAEVVVVVVVLWFWEREWDNELQIGEMVKVKENSQGGAEGLFGVWVHLKSGLCSRLCECCGGQEGKRWSSGVLVMEMYRPSSTYPRQKARLQFSAFKSGQYPRREQRKASQKIFLLNYFPTGDMTTLCFIPRFNLI